MNAYGGSVAFRIFGVSAICLSFVHYFVQKFLDTYGTRHGKTLTITQDNSHSNGALGVSDKNLSNAQAEP